MGKSQATMQQQGGKGNQAPRRPGKMANAKRSAGRVNKSRTYQSGVC